MGLLKTLWNRIRFGADKVNNSLKNTAIDGTYSIKDAKKEYDEFTQKIAKLGTQIEEDKDNIEGLKRKINTLTNIAKKAASENNEADVRAAITQKNNLQGRLNTVQNVLKTNEDLYDKMLKMRDDLSQKIQSAETNLASLSAREEAAKLAIEMNKTAAGMSSSSALAGLDDLENGVKTLEAEASAYSELAGRSNTTESLEAKYADTDSSIEDEVSQLMAGSAK